ncbi:uncharacterized protein EV420DRAFT_1736230 [Desarmillaria tabescens]|uniref:NAD(P)-binding protein n=1 Tax=Armillaria tabescens TaxID=1929756 RepID=A0AA39J8W9_ARMTA|nr:uncharacterized protein EV420DRAFT_1736230 [Desarmillaria tabescens]KAK0438321.1 hypothetical protein EV420DRAFT_1736230 [Desarmillaria tabescens]
MPPTFDTVNLKGKVVIVTGGNSGIGYGTVRHLARAGAEVYLAARNETRAAEAIEKLKTESLEPGNGDVVWLKLDLSDPRLARQSAEEFMRKEKRLDVLVNNAGMMLGPYEAGPDGMSNLVIVKLVLRFLLDVLRHVASISHKWALSGFKCDAIQDLNVSYDKKWFSSFWRYAHSKLLVILWTKSLQSQLDISEPPVPITVISLHPGSVDTFTHKWPLAPLWKLLVVPVVTSIDRGSYTSFFAAAGKDVKDNRDNYKGAYLEDKPPHIANPSKVARDDDLAEQLWTITVDFFSKLN